MIRNTGNIIIKDALPSPLNYYSEDSVYDQKSTIMGTIRIAVERLPKIHETDWPYRWGLGADLAPGEQIATTVYIKSMTSGSYRVSVIRDGGGLLVGPSDWHPVTVIEPPPPPLAEIFCWAILIVPVVGLVIAILVMAVSYVRDRINEHSRRKQLAEQIKVSPPEKIPMLTVERDWLSIEPILRNEFKGEKIVCEYCLPGLQKQGYDARYILQYYHTRYSDEVRLSTYAPGSFLGDMHEHLEKRHPDQRPVQQPIAFLKKRSLWQRLLG